MWATTTFFYILHEIADVATTGQAYQTDVTDFEDTKRVINQIAHDFNGRLDIFVANAGIPWQDGR